MAGTPTVYTGEDARIYIGSGGTANKKTQSQLAISDFSLTLSKGTAEQELVGEKGNFSLAGSISAEGSLTSCKIHSTAIGPLINDMIVGCPISVSGMVGNNSLHFYLASCQITGFDFSIGTADDITEGSLDFTMLYPYLLSSSRNKDYGFTTITENWAWV